MSGKVIVLGSGSSMGIPVIGCDCAVCKEGKPRLRPSLLIKEKEHSLVVDLTPDFRHQALTHNLGFFDGFILTHLHFDHVAGIPDLRPLFWKRETPMQGYADSKTMQSCYDQYGFLLNKVHIEWETLNESLGSVEGNIPFRYIRYFQSGVPVLGLAFGDFAYLTDIKEYDKELLTAFLRGTKRLLISCQIDAKNHINLTEAEQIAERAGVHEFYLTHLDHNFTHSLPNLAFDGMVLPYQR